MPAEVAMIERAGGVVRHVFNVPVVRAEIDLDAVPRLVREGAGSGGVQYAIRDTVDRQVALLLELDHQGRSRCL
jgi:hypothetical protein